MKKFQEFKLTRKEMTGIVAGGNYICREKQSDGSYIENLYFDYDPLDLPNSSKCDAIDIKEVGLQEED